MNEKLKHCPFCGSERTRLRTVYENYQYDVECSSCGANIIGFENEEEAIEAWNKRPLEKEKYFNGYKQGIQYCMECVQKHVFFNSVV